jgi:hypothetical protein
MVTLPEILDTVEKEVWAELDNIQGTYSDRKPLISSLRRNLQREYVERLIDLSMPEQWRQSSHKPVANLALMHLRQLEERIGRAVENEGLDAYTQAHLTEARLRISKALDAGYVLNAGTAGGGQPVIILIGATNAPAVIP